jgi:hypothetical protein
MRDLETGLRHFDILIEQNIEVDRSRPITPFARAVAPEPHLDRAQLRE